MERSFKIPLAILLGGAIIAGAIYISMPKIAAVTGGNPSLVRSISPNDHILGNPAAPVMIVMYCDFDSSYCKDFNDTLHEIITNEGIRGDVALVFRQFPLTEIHPNALSHARAAECIAESSGNDSFWKFEDALFKNQPVVTTSYGALASSIGISSDAFATCFASAATTVDGRIMADRKNALDMGAEGTPYSLILVNGKSPVVMSGAYSYDAVQQLVDDALQRAK